MEDKNPGNNLFVENLHPRTREGDLRPLFEKYGTVEDMNVIVDPHTNESRCFAFARMSSAEEAEAVIKNLNRTKIDGKTIYIQKSKRAGPRPRTPGKFLGATNKVWPSKLFIK
uniref:RRM domain-containing protein n=1 Tax=Arcella intermedia TaxID=1963864 RepID=A0A6B2LT91_9EUKA|eukprot:TRINITY_DN3943_c0_g1_i3.p1 TRINITY_DN3943_c0_g1~~TRINITY_DN3943_c0_g1_i3.p1  ORF type:complete len:113 (+),score=26.31 TRINITY_DN3943_c0_g1_i3:34-372(+)